MPNGFLPNGDQALQAFTINLSGKVSLAPATYGVSVPVAASLASALTTFQADLAKVLDPATKSKTTVEAKNASRAALVMQIRAVAKTIEGDLNVTNEQKISLGLNVRSGPAPIPPPAFAPKLDISVDGHTVKGRVHAETGSKRAKPPGCAGVFIYSFIGPTPPEDPSLYKFEGTSTRTDFTIVFPMSVAAGTQVWLSAAWCNPRTQTGPACSPVSTYIQYGAGSAAA